MRKIVITASIVTTAAMLLTSLSGCDSEKNIQVQTPQTTENDTIVKTNQPEIIQSSEPEPDPKPETVMIARREFSADTEELTLYSLDLTDEDWENIGKLEKLYALTVDSAESIDGAWEKVSGLSGITELTISGCELTQENLENIAEMSRLEKLVYSSSINNISVILGMTSLKSLSFKYSDDLDLLGLAASELNELAITIDEFDVNTDLELLDQLAAVKSLTSLTLSSRTGWYIEGRENDEVMKYIAKLKGLTSLHLSINAVILNPK